MRFEIKGVRKQYGKKMPLSDGSFTVESGECVGILGRNGSGKSTLLSILAGVQKADSGAFLQDVRQYHERDSVATLPIYTTARAPRQ